MLQALKMGWKNSSLHLPSFQTTFVKTARGTRNWVWFWLIDQGNLELNLSLKCQWGMKGPLSRKPLGYLPRRCAKQAGHRTWVVCQGFGRCPLLEHLLGLFQNPGSFQFTDNFFYQSFKTNKCFSCHSLALPSPLYVVKNGNIVPIREIFFIV